MKFKYKTDADIFDHTITKNDMNWIFNLTIENIEYDIIIGKYVRIAVKTIDNESIQNKFRKITNSGNYVKLMHNVGYFISLYLTEIKNNVIYFRSVESKTKPGSGEIRGLMFKRAFEQNFDDVLVEKIDNEYKVTFN